MLVVVMLNVMAQISPIVIVFKPISLIDKGRGMRSIWGQFKRGHDYQHNGTQHNDTQYNGLDCDTKHEAVGGEGKMTQCCAKRSSILLLC
jgi:hypothetical protein